MQCLGNVENSRLCGSQTMFHYLPKINLTNKIKIRRKPCGMECLGRQCIQFSAPRLSNHVSLPTYSYNELDV